MIKVPIHRLTSWEKAELLECIKHFILILILSPVHYTINEPVMHSDPRLLASLPARRWSSEPAERKKLRWRCPLHLPRASVLVQESPLLWVLLVVSSDERLQSVCQTQICLPSAGTRRHISNFIRNWISKVTPLPDKLPRQLLQPSSSHLSSLPISSDLFSSRPMLAYLVDCGPS